MSVKLRLQQTGKRDQRSYRIVVMDESSKRDGRVLENIGFTTKRKNGEVTLKKDRYDYWISVGALPTTGLTNILKNA